MLYLCNLVGNESGFLKFGSCMRGTVKKITTLAKVGGCNDGELSLRLSPLIFSLIMQSDY